MWGPFFQCRLTSNFGAGLGIENPTTIRQVTANGRAQDLPSAAFLAQTARKIFALFGRVASAPRELERRSRPPALAESLL
jgi:hypothetical protein